MRASLTALSRGARDKKRKWKDRSGSLQWEGFTYSRLQALKHGSGVTLTHDATGQLTGIRNRDVADATLDESPLAYDAAGNPVMKVTGDGRRTMTGTGNTMLYRRDGLRTKLHDGEGGKRMVWDDECSSGYKDLRNERQP